MVTTSIPLASPEIGRTQPRPGTIDDRVSETMSSGANGQNRHDPGAYSSSMAWRAGLTPGGCC